MPHKEKFLQTVLLRNQVLEEQVKDHAGAIDTLQAEIQRLQAIIQAQLKSQEVHSETLVKMERNLQLRVKETLAQRRALEEKALAEKKLITEVATRKADLDSAQKQILYLTKLLRHASVDSPSSKEDRDENLEFKSFVDLCLLLKVFTQAGHDGAVESSTDLDSHVLQAIYKALVKLQASNKVILKDLETLLTFCKENIVDNGWRESLKATFSLLLTSHVSIGFLYKDTGSKLNPPENSIIDPFRHLPSMQVGDPLLDSAMPPNPTPSLDAVSSGPSLNTIDNPGSYVNLKDAYTLGSGSVSSAGDPRGHSRLHSKSLGALTAGGTNLTIPSTSAQGLDDYLYAGGDIGQLHNEFNEKVFLGDSVALSPPSVLDMAPVIDMHDDFDSAGILYDPANVQTLGHAQL